MSAKRRRKIFTFKNKRRMPTWLAWLFALFVKGIQCTYRVDVEDPHGFLEEDRPWPVIFTLWHNRLLFLAGCFPASMRRDSSVLISASRDGEYASAFIRFFHLGVVRGSSSRGAVGALRKMIGCLSSGRSVVITLDGPRGPRYSVHLGAVGLARKCGVPVVPISLNAARRWELRSWDRTQIPVPFSRVRVCIGRPVGPESCLLDESASRESGADALREAMLAITDDGDV